jgi:hypothetical protein
MTAGEYLSIFIGVLVMTVCTFVAIVLATALTIRMIRANH